jgi:hypothetical protein
MFSDFFAAPMVSTSIRVLSKSGPKLTIGKFANADKWILWSLPAGGLNSTCPGGCNRFFWAGWNECNQYNSHCRLVTRAQDTPSGPMQNSSPQDNDKSDSNYSLKWLTRRFRDMLSNFEAPFNFSVSYPAFSWRISFQSGWRAHRIFPPSSQRSIAE